MKAGIVCYIFVRYFSGAEIGAQMSLDTLFFDLNSYFASVEQHLQPRLRGRPMAVAPMLTDTTCCIAASYEAKAFGVRTGTPVHEAKKLCPEIQIVPARPRVYVQYHHRIMKVVEQVIPVQTIYSIDEAACRLIGDECEPDKAVSIARAIKQHLYEKISPYIRCSVGIGPNRLIAKMASNMQKPDGLVVIEKCELPEKLYELALNDIPGIGTKMQIRLQHGGVHSVRDLFELTPKQIHACWGSIVGRWFYEALRGEKTTEPATQRRTVGHSHVLPPDKRTDLDSYRVLVRLIHKAAMRLRKLNYWAGRLTVKLSYMDKTKWKAYRRVELCQDTQSLVETFEQMWVERPGGRTPLKVSMVLTDLLPSRSVPQFLFRERQRRHTLSLVMDRVNQRCGRNVLHLGSMLGAGEAAPMRIAFGVIPDLDLPDTSSASTSINGA